MLHLPECRKSTSYSNSTSNKDRNTYAVMMGDWLKVPHSPLSGDPLRFHLPLHHTLAKAILSFCAGVIPESERLANLKKVGGSYLLLMVWRGRAAIYLSLVELHLRTMWRLFLPQLFDPPTVKLYGSSQIHPRSICT
jgi:hypothetical protein